MFSRAIRGMVKLAGRAEADNNIIKTGKRSFLFNSVNTLIIVNCNIYT